MKATKWRKRPVVIEAMQFTRESKDRVHNWITCNRYAGHDESGNPTLTIQTLEGDHLARLGDWIIRGVKGEFYPCRDDIFRATYESVTDE
jgi:hypothetical protein